MNVPPAVLDVRVTPTDGTPFHLWLPLFLLWPLALALFVIALVLTILVDVVLLLLGQRYHHYTILVARSLAALSETRGMAICINDRKASVDLKFQ